MSYGIVICSKCRREVHQNAWVHDWYHCEDKTPRCEDAASIYPESTEEIQGRWCGKDGVKYE